jgi:exonuclease SbcC
MKIIGAGDIHYCPEHKEKALASLRTVQDAARDRGVGLVAIPGDLFDRGLQASDRDAYGSLMEAIREILEIAPIVAIRGTPSHDAAGSYAPLAAMKAPNPFTVLEPGVPHFLPGLLVLGIPEPGKSWLLANKNGLGRDEANQAVVGAMKALLLGLGGLRRGHPELATVLLYHGMIRGATIGAGQVVGPGEIALGRDDLDVVGADFAILGHIHEPQDIGPRAAYTGSAYPCDWAETTQRSFLYIELDPGAAPRVERIDYPHPRRKKIVKELNEPLFPGEVKGFQVWLVQRMPKGSTLTTDLELILEEFALPGSRVTAEVIPTETVRAGQIAEAHGLPDKLAIYAENSGEKLTEAVTMKAAFLESEARAAGQAPDGLHIRIDRLRLRGAIGVWKGLGLDEIELDLAAYDPGLIALVGANGRGKTTLIENMHPYPEMLTRAGTLQDHFRLKDSYRDLTFTDERTGHEYRALIQIDGANATGRAEYHLYRDGIPVTNGRKADYEEAIGRLFGSLALFVRSAFVSQKPPKGHPDLTDATKGEKKALFRELAGLDYLQAYSEAAREKAKVLEAATERDGGRAEALQGQLAGRPDKEADLAQKQKLLQAKGIELLGIESVGKTAAARMEELRGKVERNREIEQRIRESENRQEKLRGEVESIEGNRAGYEQALAGRPEAEKTLAEIEALKAEEGKLHGEQAGILTEREQLNNQHLDTQRAVADRRRKVEAAQAKLDREVAVLAQKKKAAADRVDELEIELASTIECPGCHLKFHPDADTARAKIAQQQEAGYELDKEIQEKKRELADLDQEKTKIADPSAPQLPTFDDSRLRAIAKDLAFRDEAGAREILAAAADATVRIQEGEKRKAQIVQELAELGTQLEEARGKLLGPELEEAFTAAQQDLANREAEYRSCRDLVKTLEAVVAGLEKQLAELAHLAQELETLQEQIKGKQLDAADWRYLERATGPDGIQALELDALGPSIADTANKLLSAAYGSRFQVDFRTTRIGGTGGRKKQIEDFQIVVHDGEHGTEQLLETLSGGEAVWVKNALYSAFAIIRDRSTGQRFQTVFLDEADGQLDPEAKARYFEMIQAAHIESGRTHTIIVTHSEQAQEFIAQKINMEDLQAAGVAELVEAAR